MSTQAKIALQLIRVLDWTNPEGKIRDYYIPGWLRDDCDKAVRSVPLAGLRMEYRMNRSQYPSEMLERWEEAAIPKDSTKCYVLRKRGLFYRPNDCGYTGCITEAGRYTYAEAKTRVYLHDEPVTMHHIDEFTNL